MPRFLYVLEGIFFLFLAGVCIYGAIGLEAPMLLAVAVICLGVAIFYFYKGFAGRSKDSEVVDDLRKRISEVGSDGAQDDTRIDGPEVPKTDEREAD